MLNYIFDRRDLARSEWWAGRTNLFAKLAGLLYLIATLCPLFWYAAMGSALPLSLPGPSRVAIFGYGALISLVPHIWLWLEASAFFSWSKAKYTNTDELKEAREEFKMHADHAKALWLGVLALYAGALLQFSAK